MPLEDVLHVPQVKRTGWGLSTRRVDGLDPDPVTYHINDTLHTMIRISKKNVRQMQSLVAPAAAGAAAAAAAE